MSVATGFGNRLSERDYKIPDPPSNPSLVADEQSPLAPATVGDRGPGYEYRGIPTPIRAERRPPELLLDAYPPSHHQEIVGEMLDLFQRAKDHRRPMVARWHESYRMLRNKYWPESHPSWSPRPAIPEIFAIVHALVAWEMDQRPKPALSPMAEPNSPAANLMARLARDMEVVLNASWHNLDEELQWSIATWDKHIYGTGIVKTVWDGNLAGGLGDAKSLRVNPFYFYPDPAATCLEDASYFIEAKRMSVQELDRRYPGAAALFESGGWDHTIESHPDQITEDDPIARANPGAIPPATTPAYGQSRNGTAFRHHLLESVTVLECWTREHYIYEAHDPNTDTKYDKTVDQWRLRVVAGGRLLLDEPATNIWLHGHHPYDRIVIADTGEFWGFSTVEHLTAAQKSLNRTNASIQQNIELAGNPMLKDGETSRTAIRNAPGERLPVRSETAAATEWLMPPSPSPVMSAQRDFYLQRMEAISGLTAVMKGNVPTGRNAQGVVDAVQEAGFVRIRDSLRHLEYALRGAFTKKASLVIENYNVPRLVSVAGGDKHDNFLSLRARHFMLPSMHGAVPFQYQLKVDAGSQRHTSRQMREDRAVQLFLMQAIDRLTMLREIDFPNAEEVSQMAAQEFAQDDGVGKRERARAT